MIHAHRAKIDKSTYLVALEQNMVVPDVSNTGLQRHFDAARQIE